MHKHHKQHFCHVFEVGIHGDVSFQLSRFSVPA
jgi:hypothetical protein